MTVRADNLPERITFRGYTVKSGSTVIAGVGVKYTATEGEVDLATAGDEVVGVAMETIVGDGIKRCEVALLAGAGIIPIKVSSGNATAGKFAIAGTGGFEDRAIGGGTTARQICGWFTQTGVANDAIGMVPMRMPGVSS